jgi:hypothetical protein
MAEHYAGQGFHLNIAERRLLMFGEIAHLGLRKADIFQVARRELIQAGLDFALTQAEILPVPFVEADGKLPHRSITARLDIGQDVFDRGAHLGVIFRHRIRIPAPLQKTRHDLSLSGFCPLLEAHDEASQAPCLTVALNRGSIPP